MLYDFFSGPNSIEVEVIGKRENREAKTVSFAEDSSRPEMRDAAVEIRADEGEEDEVERESDIDDNEQSELRITVEISEA